jgi:5-methylcytosine-specific restriction enzyme subunit McrC
MPALTVHEFDSITTGTGIGDGFHVVPVAVFQWLETQCLAISEQSNAPWAHLTQRRGHRVIQFTNYVGVIRAPDGFQIEVLPKTGKATNGNVEATRKLLIEMLCCLRGFRHVQINSAMVSAARMPLWEVFISEFLREVQLLVKRGLRAQYVRQSGNLFSLRGKLEVARHLRENLCRADRFFTAHDSFSVDRPENRLLHSAVQLARDSSSSYENQKLARELVNAFDEVPTSKQVRQDFQNVQLDRGMVHYTCALDWARLLLNDETPLMGEGGTRAPSLLFPMEALFEAFVAKHLGKQVRKPQILSVQAQSRYLVRHLERDYFRLRPDLMVMNGKQRVIVLDTKWKLLDSKKSGGTDKYGLSQADFYQLQAYGQSYLDGDGDVVLIYPRTDTFDAPLPVFSFPKLPKLSLWVVPFCLQSRRLLLPDDLATKQTAFAA